MPIAKITSSGLAAMAVAVALLWGCIVGEQFHRRAAVADRARVMREVRRMQFRQRRVPASTPSPFLRVRPHVAAG
jgi:hypothetical protein